jgi:hypothetical protein
MRKENYTNNIVADEEFRSYEDNGIWPATNVLQNMLKWSKITTEF